MFNLEKIKACQLCLGCGACESFCSDIHMIIDNHGFIIPDSNQNFTKKEDDVLSRICPGINIDCIKPNPTSFGKIISVFEGYSTDRQIRHKSSSGGIISALCCHLLQSGEVDGIIQVRKSPNHHMLNEVHVSTTTDDVLESASSRYAPVSMFKNIRQLMETNTSTYAFVGKPCDIMTITRILECFPEWKKYIKYKISLVCAGTPSFNATNTLIESGKKGRNIKPLYVKYRGDGWPGNFRVSYDDNSSFELDYNESWGKVLGRNLNFRCKICPDGIGQYADIVVGDSWSTKDGYPDFSEKDGRSFILVRTTNGINLIHSSQKANAILCTELNINKLKSIQPYQYQRLQYASYKLLGAKLCTGTLLKIRNMHFTAPTFVRGLRSLLGTIKRFKKS